MRLTYAIRLEDFRALQRPFVLRAGNNTGFKGVLVACGLIALLGVFCFAVGMGVLIAGFLSSLGCVAAGLAYLYDKRSVGKAQEVYEKGILAAYGRVHCADQRVFEADDRTFSTTCKCGTVSRPWAELIQLSENEHFLSLATKAGATVLPKSAFNWQAELTEFRALVTSKLNQSKPVTARHFDFTCMLGDLRSAHLLHAMKGGGWRGVLKQTLTLVCVTAGWIVIWRGLASSHSGVRFGLMGGALAVVLLVFIRRRPKPRLLPVRVYFSDEGLYLQDSVNQVRNPWSNFIGYLEDEKRFLLYYNPKVYRLIPKRALGECGSEFRKLVLEKLSPYDYRNPIPLSRELGAKQQPA